MKEFKGLSAAGANLEFLQLSRTNIASLDVSNNPNLKELDLYGVKEITKLDLTNNLKLTKLRTALASNLADFKLGDNTELTELIISHMKLSMLDIHKFPEVDKTIRRQPKSKWLLGKCYCNNDC